MNCIFCDIAKGDAPSHAIWENDDFIAFLSIFPNTEGFTVVIPKEHHSSYIFEVANIVMHNLMEASKEVAQKIENSFEDVGRVAVIFEGFGVNHLHAKLVPLHGTSSTKWEKQTSTIDTYFNTYLGYISSHDSMREDDSRLALIAKKIKEN